jgi:hypothetical protein
MRASVALLLALALASALCPACARATEFGVHMDLTYDGHAWRREAAVAAAREVLRAAVSRNSFPWHLVEREEGKRDWSRVDAVVDELANAGLAPLFTVYGSPAWASGASTTRPGWELEVPQEDAAFERWVEAYAEFMRAAVRRYRGRVRLWEVGNEPNERHFWRPQPDPRRYAAWFRTVSAAIRAEAPEARIAIGGLTGLTAGCCITGRAFLGRLLAEERLDFDAVAIHPYSGHAPDRKRRGHSNFDDISLIRDMLVTAGRDVPIWLTEWGWSSRNFGVERQADWIGVSLEMIRDRYPYVEIATVFLDYDRLPQYAEGLLDESFAPKPAAHRFARFVESLRAHASDPK